MHDNIIVIAIFFVIYIGLSIWSFIPVKSDYKRKFYCPKARPSDQEEV